MKTQLTVAYICLLATMIFFSAGIAEAANGALVFSFKYKNPTTGVESFLDNANVYLHKANTPPPLEKFFSRAFYIGQESYPSVHKYCPTNIPEGNYYIRITQRKVLSDGKFGPPTAGDYTWFQTIPITIIAGKTLVLSPTSTSTYVNGLTNSPNPAPLYATVFGSAGTQISGTIKLIENGRVTTKPAVGRYMRAQTVPCYDDGSPEGYVNSCGPFKYIALRPTDASGSYTLFLRDPGTYYLYTSPCLTADWDDYTGNRCDYYSAGTVTVKAGDRLTVNAYSY